MSTTKKICGNYTIKTVCTDGEIFLDTNVVTINGNLNVLGSTQQIVSQETTIADNTIILNQGETGAGVSALYAGIRIDRGTATDTELRYNDTNDRWEGTDDGVTWYPLNPAFMPSTFEVVDDPSPQLGGFLDVNGFEITSASDGDVVITADGNGQVKIDKALSLEEQASDPTAVAGYAKLYAKTPDKGQTGLYVAGDDIPSDELISRRRALVYSIIL